ncbi:hypothetical protein IMG5_083840 [Ichthyophthirius multifiliis]|uniref:Dynein regulatory complex protein 9 n=1 Tax=Ichthyophthirius multifiliis TaxID=5932 RepID=G0QQT9_ICHMU|nr:hypothetical protein IMG5_083840 [Ichthyophthirius multifiliis]EGR32415.1 hypothetical protein IMG5_083840 [Ichthyophthirius multifiliis]|eukprot:XP_004036401.1 hypothetical protein IMG5_083840 [Ichthyophthirius multifiliis]
MNPIDTHKLTIILEDSSENLAFLHSILPQDDLSSELAGYEISKLLKKQKNLENSYAELVNLRTSLTGIQNKQKLNETQVKIVDVAQKLKESTKKLCRLFKENPNLENDALKVQRDRQKFMEVIENLILMVQNNTMNKFQNLTTQELEDQDKLRKLIFREKELYQEIKKLCKEIQEENKEYDNEQKETNLKIQHLKERLLYKRNRAFIKNQYREKETKAQEGTLDRMYEWDQKLLKDQIKNMHNKIETENLVYAELREFLISKEEKIRQQNEEWDRLLNTKKQQLEDQIEELRKQKDRDVEELEKLRQRDQEEREQKDERDRQEILEAQQKQQDELNQIRLDNAIKLIQIEYQEWKLGGGGKKKRKGGKKKKK